MNTTTHSRVNKQDFLGRVAANSMSNQATVVRIYEAILSELIEAVNRGETVMFTGFGRFYQQTHKGHKVRFGREAVDDYAVLKFSASRSINRLLELDAGPDERHHLLEAV